MTDLQSSVVTRAPLDEEDELATGYPGESGADEATPAQTDGPDGGRGHAHSIAPDDERPVRTFRVPDVPFRQLAGLALVGIGLLIVLFLVYLFAFTPLSASRSQQQLAQSLTGKPLFRYSLVAGHSPAEGSPVGVLEIPALNLDQIVVQGTSAADLMNGPGLMLGSALPGSPGNAVIAGRRVTFGAPFGSLGQLRPGDRIRVVDGAGTFIYRVSKVETVTAGQRDVITPTTTNRLTLVTSDSTFLPNGRLAAVAKLVGRPVAAGPGTTIAVPSYELGLSGDPVAGGLAVMWSLLTIALLVGAGLAVWRWRRPWLIYLFTAPIVVACGLFACESVARALPATL
jgi:sortase A